MSRQRWPDRAWDEAIASARGKSSAGSLTASPPVEAGVDVTGADVDAAAARQDGDEEGEAVAVEPCHGAAWRAEPGGRHEGLDLDQRGRLPSSSAAATAPGAGTPPRRPRKAPTGSATSRRPACGHLQDGDLVGGAVAVLERTQEPQAAVALAVEREDRVDEMLECPRPGEAAVLGDLPDEQDRDAVLVREGTQRAAEPRDLPTEPGRPIELLDGRPSGSNRRRRAGAAARAPPR